MDKVALGQVFLRVLRFSPDSIVPPLLHIHSCIILVMDKVSVSGPFPQTHILNPSKQQKAETKLADVIASFFAEYNN
jgi:hypothetical protein